MFGPGTFLFTREAIIDNFLKDLPVRKGTYISIMNFGNHHS